MFFLRQVERKGAGEGFSHQLVVRLAVNGDGTLQGRTGGSET
jgi:hypothetical protein